MIETQTKTDMTKHFSELGLAVIDTELAAISRLRAQMNETFDEACQLMLACEGRVVVTGMGKSGHIAGKIAATLASTGTPAFYVHPGEASHGDLGMITRKDVVVALSNSGETREIITILPIIGRLNVPLIALTGNADSTLAKEANVHLDVSIEKEACPLNLAPTASTTAALVMGDALAIALLEAKGFSEKDFALSHPGGSLGKRLLLHVDDVMHKGTRIPKVTTGTSITKAIVEMSAKRLGMTAIVDQHDQFLGIFTDGDLRRSLENPIDLSQTPIDHVMTKNPITAKPGILAAEALALMQKYTINGMFILDENQHIEGALNTQDLLQKGVL
jgi:arabinose-5-phosphate isomerase